jgi:hypothetical protein
MHGIIQSIGLPPERHADRVVAEMMRDLARKHATLWDTLTEVISSCRGGSPKAQAKLAERIKRAGAYHTKLYPGKRGKFMIMIHDFTGFDPWRDKEIGFGDPVPEKPWISGNISLLQSPGGGRDTLEVNSRPLLFITHHAMSRVAQRLGLRTSDHLIGATHILWNGCIDHINRHGRLNDRNDEGKEKWLAAPPEGWRVPIPPIDGARAVLKRHETRRALIAATVIMQ